MADLVLKAADDGLGLPLQAGKARLLLAQPKALVSVMPFTGQSAAVSKALNGAIGTGLPATGTYADGEQGRVFWAGLDQYWVAASEARIAESLRVLLSGKAAVADQGDGWVMLALIGAGARDVMARLCPLDLSPEVFPAGTSARSDFAHMMALITAIPDGFGISVMRSFARGAVHHVRDAMESVAAQG